MSDNVYKPNLRTGVHPTSIVHYADLASTDGTDGYIDAKDEQCPALYAVHVIGAVQKTVL